MHQYWQFAADLEYLEQVEELAVGVSADGDGRTDMDHVGLSYQDFLGLRRNRSTF